MITRIFFALAISALAASHASAEGLYAGADIGVTNVEESDAGYQDRPIGWKVHGGYSFNDLFALEASYVDTGEAEDNGLTVDMSGYVMSLVLQSDSTTPNLFTKIGYHHSEMTVSEGSLSFEDDVDGFALGVGFRHGLTNNLAIRGEIDVFESDLDNMWSAGVGVQISFGN